MVSELKITKHIKFRQRRWGSCSPSRARGTLRSDPHRHQRKFSGARFCRIASKHLPQTLQSHIQDSSHKSGPLFAIFRPKSAFLGGQGGSPKFFFHWILHIFVTQEPMQNSKTVAQTLLGETAHFGLFPPKIGFFRGVGGVPEIFFSLESSYFCYLGAHAKN